MPLVLWTSVKLTRQIEDKGLSTTEHWPSTLGDVLQLKKKKRKKRQQKMLIYHLAVIDENSLITDF